MAAMDDEPVRFWRFGVADLLAAVTAVGLWLGLFPMIRRIQPVIDPVFLTVVLTVMLGLLLAGFMARKQSKSLAVLCLVLATLFAIILARICVTDFK
jgi:predicted PurR-regulated permease PerM